MKIWKTVGCLALLFVIVAGCVALGRNTEVSAITPPTQEEPLTEDPPSEDGEQPESTPPEESVSGSTTVSKAYSEGLYFRSNGDGTCALAGMGSCTEACVLIPPRSPAGDTVTEILPYAFAQSIVGAVEIPSTVKSVSAASCAECSRLGYIRVAAGNEALSEHDGVLYNGDGSLLLFCPAGRTSGNLILPATLKRIAAGALGQCKALETVYFMGNTAEWHSIIVGDENEALYEASLRFSTRQ